MKTEELINLILQRKKEGRVVFYEVSDSLTSIPVDKLCNQPVEGILYDLNRGEETILAFAGEDNPYWVNNFAATQVIRYLKARVEELEKELNK